MTDAATEAAPLLSGQSATENAVTEPAPRRVATAAINVPAAVAVVFIPSGAEHDAATTSSMDSSTTLVEVPHCDLYRRLRAQELSCFRSLVRCACMNLPAVSNSPPAFSSVVPLPKGVARLLEDAAELLHIPQELQQSEIRVASADPSIAAVVASGVATVHRSVHGDPADDDVETASAAVAREQAESGADEPDAVPVLGTRWMVTAASQRQPVRGGASAPGTKRGRAGGALPPMRHPAAASSSSHLASSKGSGDAAVHAQIDGIASHLESLAKAFVYARSATDRSQRQSELMAKRTALLALAEKLSS